LLADHLGGDAVQPRPGVAAAGLVTAAVAERRQEHLGHDIGLLTQAPRRVAADLIGVQGFVVSETNGRWGRAIALPGLEALNTGGNAGVLSVSCASPGNCAAGGFDGDGQGFVVSEKNPARFTRRASAASRSS
jgi:hypothetical protein